MLRHVTKKIVLALFCATLAIAAGPAAAAKKENFRIAWSIYVGWMPWAYAAEKGIVQKWAP